MVCSNKIKNVLVFFETKMSYNFNKSYNYKINIRISEHDLIDEC